MHNLSKNEKWQNFRDATERLTQSITHAKAITAIGASAEMEEYRGDILNDYFDAVLSHLQIAGLACEEVSKFANEQE